MSIDVNLFKKLKVNALIKALIQFFKAILSKQD
jgi:hypothetical protein